MPPYQNKSFEEIRLEDYTGAAVTQPNITTATTAPGFGNSPNNFSPAKTTFGASTGGFGATATGGFGGNKGFMSGAGMGAKPAGFGGFGQTQNQFQVSLLLSFASHPFSLLFLSLSFLAPATATPTPTTRRFWWRRLRPIWRSWRRCWSTKHRLRLASVPTFSCDRTLSREEHCTCDPCHHCDAAIPKQKL
jgi:hypothetical protein